MATHSYSAFGTYSAVLTVTDDNAPARTDTTGTSVSVRLGNRAPMADAGGPYGAVLGEGLVLDGSGSFDPDIGCGDEIVSYRWDIAGGVLTKSGSHPALSPAELQTLGIGTFDVVVTVEDSLGATDSDAAQLTITDELKLSNVMITSPVDEGSQATLSGTILNPPEGRTLTLQVDWGDGSAVETFSYAAETTGFQETHIYRDDAPSGTASDDYEVSLTLTDAADLIPGQPLPRYSFTEIARADGAGLSPFEQFPTSGPPSINNLGAVVFEAMRDGAGLMGIYKGEGGPTTRIAETGDAVVTGSLQLPAQDAPTISDAGVVVFAANADPGGGQSWRPSVWSSNGGPIVAYAISPADPWSGTFSSGWVAGSGTAVVVFGVAAGEDLYLSDGAPPSLLYDTSTIVAPDIGAIFEADITDHGVVAAAAGPDTGVDWYILRGDGGPLTVIAQAYDDPVRRVQHVSINNSGVVAFYGEDSSGSYWSIFTGAGGALTEVVNTQSGSSPFSEFASYGAAINDAGTVAFQARRWGTFDVGIFTGSDPVADRVILQGDPLLGSTVSSLVFSRFGLNNAGQVAFYASLANGDRVIARADPVHVATASVMASVANVAPEITAVRTDPPQVVKDRPFQLQLDFTDPGTLDTHVVTVDWGDGGPPEEKTVPAGQRTLAIGHQYPAAAPYAVTVRLADDDLGEDAAETTVCVVELDFGDAPDSRYQTLLASDGARHAAVGPRLGAARDAEDDGQPDSAAAGDDRENVDDEDGVRALTSLTVGTDVQFRVTASEAGILNAWLDANDDGDWDDAGEHFVTDQALAAGANDISRFLPVEATVTASTFARFRFSTEAGLDVRGWASDGEVEDYEVSIHAVRQWVVDSTDDNGDVNVGDGICATGNGACTLRAAIQEANALANRPGGPDEIVFAIPGTGPHAIRPASALPTITDPVVIDATTQPDFGGAPRIEVDGSLAGPGASGLRLGTGGNTIRGLAVNRFAANGILLLSGGGNSLQGNYLGVGVGGAAVAANGASGIEIRTAGNVIGGVEPDAGNLISGNTQFGILLTSGGTGNRILGNRIGTNAAGTAAVANGLYGIYVTSANNEFGGPVAGEGNLISGNARGGLAITGATATGNLVRGNRVGTKADGASALANGNAGVTVSNAPGNSLGGTAAGAGNVLSGNALHGAMIVGAATTNTLVQGNLVGLNAAGTSAVPNGQYGITNYAPNNLLGGSDAGAGNTVSGNNYSGVLVYTPTATGVRVQGNRIGTNAAGTAAVPNGFYGVYVNSTDNLIGGPAAGEGNQISGNTRGGVALTEKTAKRNAVQGNRIGTSPDGTAALPNGGSGVTVSEGSNNTIGGTAVGAGNQISGNGVHGVIVVGVNASGNAVVGNLIGLAPGGTAALPNGQYGVAVYSSNTTIGAAGGGNTISGNGSGGLIVYGAAAGGAVIQANRIGTDVTGSTAVPNGGYGIFLVASGGLVGGTGAGEGNTIAWNGSSGVYVAGAGSVGNSLRQNAIWKNGLWGIDLAPYGATPNDLDDSDTGTNLGQNFPVLTAAVLTGGRLDISYSVPSSTANSAYPLAVEFFLADADNQEGQTCLGGASYAAPGADSAALTVSGVAAGQRLVATATDAIGNTSEFSASFVIAAGLQASALADGVVNPAATLDIAALTPLVGQAIAAWESAGLDAARVARLRAVEFKVADLPGRYLGWATPERIVLDADAAGWGWHVGGWADSGSPVSALDARLSGDLLTAVLHELGHVLGLPDLEDEDALMGGVLRLGTRHLPTTAAVDQVLAGGDWLD